MLHGLQLLLVLLENQRDVCDHTLLKLILPCASSMPAMSQLLFSSCRWCLLSSPKALQPFSKS